MKLYKFKVIREDLRGNQGKRTKNYICYGPDLKVGGIYCHLGPGFPGFQRVVSLEVEELPEQTNRNHYRE